VTPFFFPFPLRALLFSYITKKQKGSKKIMSIEQKEQLTQHQLAVLATEMDKRKKSVGVAYFLWLILGTFGVHKFYTGQKTPGIVYLILGILGWTTVWFAIGFVFFVILGILLLIDLFTLPKQVRQANEKEEEEIINRIWTGNMPRQQDK
jgi:TM2 domain-containing membrane protein YozV